MRKNLMATMWLGIWFLIPGSVFASSAWWVMCDSCTSDTAFRHQALTAPGSYTPIYVTNRETNETRKYNRWTFLEDFDTGVTQWTEVVSADFPVAEKSVFEQAVEDATTIFVGLPRSNLTQFSGAGLRDSAVEEIAAGRLSSDFLSSLRNYVRTEDFFPSVDEISGEIGTTIGGLSSSLSVSPSGVRKFPLQVTVTFGDGSKIKITLSADASEWSEVAIFDADGNEIAVVLPSDGSGNATYDPRGNDGREFRFGGGEGAANAIRQLQRAVDGMLPPGTGGGGCFTYIGETGGTTCKQE
ncbi:MAG: hypothetical protein WD397_09745 [Wenzhouxiangellaceae bacterium]